jgi:diphosphomevalonate decarboxylase
MTSYQATAQAHPNIALIKYWGNRDQELRLPSNPSLSMNLAGLTTTTTVEFDPALTADRLIISGHEVHGLGLERVSRLLKYIRQMAGAQSFARVDSHNDFPSGAGLASSASAFAALALAGSAAARLNLDEAELSRLARLGSGSACRSVPGGFVEWEMGQDDATSVAHSIAPPEHWDLRDLIALVDIAHKSVGSTQGHALADTSPLQTARVQSTPDRLARARAAVLRRDFAALTEVVELDSLIMHAVMMTSTPALMYWQPATLDVLYAVMDWRRDGLAVCATVDAGSNVHVLCPAGQAGKVERRLRALLDVREVLVARPGGPARLV